MAVDSVRVLFVCMGNICRSPTGEGVFRHYVENAGSADRIEIDSAGIIGFHQGDSADSRMREAASRRGYSLDSIARQVRSEDFDGFDLIIGMDGENMRDLQRLSSTQGAGSADLKLLGEFLNDTGAAPPVPDPYYGGAEGFEQVLDMIEAACPSLHAHCLQLHAEKSR